MTENGPKIVKNSQSDPKWIEMVGNDPLTSLNPNRILIFALIPVMLLLLASEGEDTEKCGTVHF